MAGSMTGGKKAAQSNKKKYGPHFYELIGAKGGSATHTKPRGFAASRAHAIFAGHIGGSMSSRDRNRLLTPEQRARKRRKLEQEKTYTKLLRLHEASKQARGVKVAATTRSQPGNYLPLPGAAAEADYKALEGESDEQ